MWWQFIVEQTSGTSNKVVTQLFDKDNHGQDDPLGRYLFVVKKEKKTTIPKKKKKEQLRVPIIVRFYLGFQN